MLLKKLGIRNEQKVTQRYTAGQQRYKNLCSITYHSGNTNQNSKKISHHIHETGTYKKRREISSAESTCWEKEILIHC